MYNVQYEQNGISRHLTTSTETPTTVNTADNSTPGSCCNPQTSDTGASGSSPEVGTTDPLQGDQQQHPDLENVPPHLKGQVNSVNGIQLSTEQQQLLQHQQTNYGPLNGHYPHTTFAGTAQVPQMPESADIHSAHNCSCGEGCACLACLTHPYNKTTLEYVRYHTDFSMRHDEATFPTANQNHTPQNGIGVNGLTPWLQHGSGTKDVPNGATPWQPHVLPQQTPTQELEHFHIKSYPTASDVVQASSNETHTPESNGHSSSHVPSTPNVDFSRMEDTSGFEQNSPQQNEDTSTLSPSSFFLQSYTLPGCDDATGTCQCGDGCTCTGCLTHTGHQAPQQPPTDSSSHTSHGSGCACPHPALRHNPNTGQLGVQGAVPHQIPTSYLDQHQAAPSTPFASPNGLNGMPVSTFTHVHGPNCACPVDSAVLQAQAQVQAHAQLHGPQCRCPTGVVFLNAQLQAEARLHNQLHGTSANGWAAGAPG